MNWSIIFVAILVLATVVSCGMIYGNNEQNMDEVDMTTASMFLNTESNGEGPGSFAKRWYRWENRRWGRPYEHRWRRW
jgi:hypothetical protein